MRQRGWLLLFFGCIVLGGQAQDIEATVQEPKNSANDQDDSLRNIYIQRFPDHFFIWPVLKRRSLSFEMRSENDRQKIKYSPNNAFTFGLGAYLFDLALEITGNIPLDEKSRTTYGESSAHDFQINALTRSWGLDLFRQKYDGYYVDDPDISYAKGDPYPQRPDIEARNFGVTLLYVFTPTRYSLKSAFNFAERQIKSGGSFLMTSTVSSFKVAGDSALLEDKYQTEFGNGSDFNTTRNTTFSIAPGYAYTYVHRNVFISGALMVGPAHNWIYHASDTEEKNDIKINTFTSVRFGVGYSGDRFFGGVNYVLQSRAARFDDIRLVSATSTFRFLLGYRFSEFGILKKSVWDFPKQLLQ